MADNDDTQEEKSEDTDAPIDGADNADGEDTGTPELTEEDKVALIEGGQKLKALEAKYPDINFDKLPADYTQKSQKLSEFEKAATAPKGDDNAPDPIEAAMADAGWDEKDKEYMRKKIIPIMSVVSKRDAQVIADAKIAERSNKDSIDTEIKNMGTKHDGSDGLPKFDKDTVLAHGQTEKIFNLEAAYRDLYQDEVLQKAVADAQSPKKTFTEKPGQRGIRLPSGKKMSFGDGSVKDAVKETLEKLTGGQ